MESSHPGRQPNPNVARIWVERNPSSTPPALVSKTADDSAICPPSQHLSMISEFTRHLNSTPAMEEKHHRRLHNVRIGRRRTMQEESGRHAQRTPHPCKESLGRNEDMACMEKGRRMCFRPPTVDQGPVKCPQCGAEVDPSLDKCPNCGAVAAPAPGMATPPGVPPVPGAPGAPGAPKVPSVPQVPSVPKVPSGPKPPAPTA